MKSNLQETTHASSSNKKSTEQIVQENEGETKKPMLDDVCEIDEIFPEEEDLEEEEPKERFSKPKKFQFDRTATRQNDRLVRKVRLIRHITNPRGR